MSKTTTAPARRYVSHIEHANPMWSNAQRIAWQAARDCQRAMLEISYAYEQFVLTSQEPLLRVSSALLELEREIAPLFEEA